MKQRIEELVNQSKFFANDERLYLERVHNREYSQDEWQDICFEKFAELIVEECAGVGYDASYFECALNVSNKILEHFGVEK